MLKDAVEIRGGAVKADMILLTYSRFCRYTNGTVGQRPWTLHADGEFVTVGDPCFLIREELSAVVSASVKWN